MARSALKRSEEPRVRHARKPASAALRTRLWHRFKVVRRKLGRAAVITVGPLAVRLLAWTWRTTREGEERVDALRASGNGYFMALWHGRMLIPVAHHGNQGYHVLVSTSGDGDVSGALLKRLGYGVLRGSSRKRAVSALRTILDLMQTGAAFVLTPDGPTGPPHTIKPGLAWMASETGRPVVPCGFAARGAWHLGSWDRFTIPLPFARVAFVYGEAVHVSAGAGEEELERAAVEVRERIQGAERRCFELLGMEPDG